MQDVTPSEELPMEVIYDTFEIPVPISPVLMEVSPTPPVSESSAPRKPQAPQISPAQELVKQKSTKKRKKVKQL